jgi:hypothetical protein
MFQYHKPNAFTPKQSHQQSLQIKGFEDVDLSAIKQGDFKNEKG